MGLLAAAFQFPLAPQSFGTAGDLYVTDLSNGSVMRYEPDGTAHTFASGLVSPQGITFDKATDTTAAYFYVADAGDGGPTSGIIYRYDRNANRTVFKTGLNNPIGVAVDASDIIVAENGAGRVVRLPIDGSAETIALVVDNPLGLDTSAFDQSGFLTKFIATGDSVFRLDPSHGGMPVDIDPDDVSHSVGVDPVLKDVYVTTEAGTISKLEADGTSKVTFASGFVNPQGVAFVPSGVPQTLPGVYVADSGASEIFRIVPNGTSLQFVSGGTPNFLVFQSNSGPDPVPTPTPTPTATPTPTVSPTATPAAKALNISSRVDVETGDDIAIAGFIINGGTNQKMVAIRAIGASLANANPPVTDALSDPVLELHGSDGSLITTNDSWLSNSSQDQGTIVAAGLNMFAGSVISPSEPIIVASLDPGAYTAVVQGVGGATGVGLVEVYDLDDPATSTSELANISTRGIVGTADDVLIGGLIIGPDEDGILDASVVVRALGPSLANNVPPITDPLADPMVALFNVDGDVIAMNDNWETDPEPNNYAAEVTAAGLAPTDDAEAAIFANLIPGQYTAVVTGVDGGVGVALVEIYHVPTPSGAN